MSIVRSKEHGASLFVHGQNSPQDRDLRADQHSPTIRCGIEILLEAFNYANEVEHDRWQFAVELAYLLDAGLSVSDARRLVSLGYAAHAREVTESESEQREFHQCVNLAFSQESCFVLTDEGVLLSTKRSLGELSATTGSVPQFEIERRELSYLGRTVKRFKQPSANQERILIAFQEDGWPGRIADPLRPDADLCSKQRLGDAIKRLNRHQQAKLLHFYRDGTGEGICWEPTAIA